jgi:glycosyltransferase involved in cell wall biosynthesis
VLDQFPLAQNSGNRVPKIGIIANLLPVKGHLDFLQMAHELLTDHIEAEHWIIGGDVLDSGYGQVLEDKTRELGLAKHVRFWGHRSDVASLVRQLDVVVCSSHVEPFGICSLEAMACGKPVVATRVGGIPEVVQDGLTGFLVPPRTPTELARAVKQFVQNPDLSRAMGLAGRKRVENHFTHTVQAEKILAIYQAVSREGSQASMSDPVESPPSRSGLSMIKDGSSPRYDVQSVRGS